MDFQGGREGVKRGGGPTLRAPLLPPTLFAGVDSVPTPPFTSEVAPFADILEIRLGIGMKEFFCMIACFLVVYNGRMLHKEEIQVYIGPCEPRHATHR